MEAVQFWVFQGLLNQPSFPGAVTSPPRLRSTFAHMKESPFEILIENNGRRLSGQSFGISQLQLTFSSLSLQTNTRTQPQNGEKDQKISATMVILRV
jgi:hypothetical protein